MARLILILLTLISIQGFSQVKEINKDDFKKLSFKNSELIYRSNSIFINNMRGRIASIRNKFELIELDTITYKLHIKGQVYSLENNGKDLTADINIGEIISEDSIETKMKFTHYFHTDKKGFYDISFIVNNENSLLSFNGSEKNDGMIIGLFSDLYQVGNLLK